MLRACRRLLKPGGRTAFYVIHLAAGLSGARRDRATATGPPHTATRGTYRTLLRSAGFVDITGEDVTAAYLDTARSWVAHTDEMAAELAALDLPTSLEERQANRRRTIEVIEDGLLRRSLFVATRPVRST